MVLSALASCATDQSTLLRSDMPIQGMDVSVTYRIESAPDGKSELNEAMLMGINAQSPLPQLVTTFGRGAGTRTQTVQVTAADGTAVNVLGMTKQTISFGLSDFLVVDAATYEMRDVNENRTCGAKIRMNFQPNAQQFFDGDRRSWDALWYYTIPCGTDPSALLEIENAEFMGLVLNQQTSLRITGKPIFFNRGHSVTIVGGKPAELAGGWWTKNASPESNQSILGAADMIKALISDLDNSQDPWMAFSNTGEFQDSALVYSAGDADVFLSFRKQFLNREVDYIVNFRSTPEEPWHTIVVHPVYNFEWNDFGQNWEALGDNFNPAKIDERLDKNGFPKDPNDSVLKEIETAGCQNCPNPTLEQIQLRDGETGDILYAMTIRGYIGAENSLVMFGEVPSKLDDYQKEAQTRADAQGTTSCPVRYDDKGERLPTTEQLSQDNCAKLLREGALWNWITENPDDFGFDVVGQFRVRDNSTWTSQCSGSGEYTSCVSVPVDRKLNASYLFNTADVQKSWVIMQLLGEVGVRTLGLSYASGQFAGSGLLFAMEQPMMRQQYFDGLSSPEMLFAFDARALQLPDTLGQAWTYLTE
jgi:hypothetical protein